MASGVALRESVKEMKRLKNEPLLMLVIIAIILFVGFFVVYPVIRVITFPSGQDYMQLFQKARWFTALKKQPVHDPDLHGVLHGGGIPLCIRYCPVGCSL